MKALRRLFTNPPPDRPQQKSYLPLEMKELSPNPKEGHGIAAFSACIQDEAAKARIKQTYELTEFEWSQCVNGTNAVVQKYIRQGATWEEVNHPTQTKIKKLFFFMLLFTGAGGITFLGYKLVSNIVDTTNKFNDQMDERDELYPVMQKSAPDLFYYYPTEANETEIQCVLARNESVCMNTPCWVADMIFIKCETFSQLGEGKIEPNHGTMNQAFLEKDEPCMLFLYQGLSNRTPGQFAKFKADCDDPRNLIDIIAAVWIPVVGYLLLILMYRTYQINRSANIWNSPATLLEGSDANRRERNNKEPSIGELYYFLKDEMEALKTNGFFGSNQGPADSRNTVVAITQNKDGGSHTTPLVSTGFGSS